MNVRRNHRQTIQFSGPAARDRCLGWVSLVRDHLRTQALLDFFGEGRQAASYPEIEDVFAALHTGEIDFGVVPIENSHLPAAMLCQKFPALLDPLRVGIDRPDGVQRCTRYADQILQIK